MTDVLGSFSQAGLSQNRCVHNRHLHVSCFLSPSTSPCVWPRSSTHSLRFRYSPFLSNIGVGRSRRRRAYLAICSRSTQTTYLLRNNDMNNSIIASNRIDEIRSTFHACISLIHRILIRQKRLTESKWSHGAVIWWHWLAMKIDLSPNYVLGFGGSILFFFVAYKMGRSFVILHIELAWEEGEEVEDEEQKYRYKHTEIMSNSKDDERVSHITTRVHYELTNNTI